MRWRCWTLVAPRLLAVLLALFGPARLAAQSLGAGTIRGIVIDETGARLPSASVELANALTGYSRQSVTGADGMFALEDVPQNSYIVRVRREGFQVWQQTVAIRSTVPVDLRIQLSVAGQ